MWKELKIPDLGPWSLKWNDTIHVNQRVRLPNKIKVNWETYKVWKTCVHHTSYMATRTRRKVNKYASENFLEVNPVMMNYKIRHNKNRRVRYSLAWPLFPLLFVVAEKQKNVVWTCKAMCKGSHGERLAQCENLPQYWSSAVGRWILLHSQLGICENQVTILM